MTKTIKTIICFCILLSLLPIYGAADSSNLSTWKTVISCNNFEDSAFNGKNQYIVVGGNGDIRTSADAVTWKRQNSGTANTLTKVIWDGKQYLAVGSNGTILTSSDGIAWNAQTSNTKIGLHSVMYDGQQYIAVGWDYIIQEKPYVTLHSVILRSDDAIKWNVLSVDPQLVLNNIYSNGKIYLISSENGKFLKSDNGKDWTLIDTGFNSPSSWTLDVTWNGSKFVAVGTGGLVLTSTDGSTWSKVRLINQPSLVSIIYDGRQFIAVDENRSIAFSSDGSNWSFQNINTKNYLTRIVFTGEKYIIIGFGETILTSNDCKNWQSASEKTKYFICGAATNNKLTVMVGGNGIILTSSDGQNWTEQVSSTTDTLRDVYWDGNQFISIGDAGTYLTSQDGITWNKKVISQIINPEEIIYANNQYVIIGMNALILTSPDGNIWTKQTWSDHGTYDTWLRSIAWNGEQYIAVGMYGKIITSTDGVKWVNQNSHTQNDFNSIIWAGSQFVAVGDWKTVAVSKDGINWTATAVDYDYPIKKIIWNGKYYLATAYGKFLTSIDAQNWTEASIGGEDLYFAGVWNGYNYVLGGRFGTVITSTPIDLIKVTVDGIPISFDVAPITVNDRTLVPLRYIFNAVGAEVKWDESTQTITAQKGKSVVTLKIGSDQANVSGALIKMDVPAMKVNGRTMVPARFIAECLNCNVDWNNDTKTVIIQT